MDLRLGTMMTAGIATVLLLGAASAASAGIASGEVGAVPGCSRNPVTLDDVSPASLKELTFAADHGAGSLAELVRREGAVDKFMPARDVFERDYPEAFAGSQIGDDGCYYLYLTTTAGAAARSAGTALTRLPGVVVVADRKASLKAMHSWSLTAYEALTDALGEYPQMVYYDQRTGLLRVEVAVGQGATAIAVITKELGLSPDLLDVAEVPRYQGSVTSTIMGGGAMTSCTSGFSVHTSVGNGIVTADHCADDQQYGGLSNIEFVSGAVRESNGHARGDLQWHKAIGGAVAVPRFRATSTEYRDVLSVGAPTVGQTVCKFGKVSNASCDRVDVTCAVFTISDGPYDCMHFTENHNLMPGDSGGPWYYGNSAMGVSSGHWWNAWSDRDVFSPIYRIGVVLPGVSVLQ
jgi:hypothetical protein